MVSPGTSRLSRYRKSYAEFLETEEPRVGYLNIGPAIDLAWLQQELGDTDRARVLLDGAETIVRAVPRLGSVGYQVSDVQIHAIRGESEFKAVFADIERDMEKQRAVRSARPEEAPLSLGAR